MKWSVINQTDVYWTHFLALSVINYATPTTIIYVIILAIFRTPLHNALFFLQFWFDEWVRSAHATQKSTSGADFFAPESPFSYAYENCHYWKHPQLNYERINYSSKVRYGFEMHQASGRYSYGANGTEYRQPDGSGANQRWCYNSTCYNSTSICYYFVYWAWWTH